MALIIDAPDLTESTPERIMEWLEELEELREETLDDAQAQEIIARLALMADAEMEAAVQRVRARTG